jgi:hypothetical protein
MQAFEKYLNQISEEFKKTANGWNSFAAYIKSPHTKAITIEDWNNIIGLMGHTDAYVRALRPMLETFGPTIVEAIVETSKGNFIDHIRNSEDEGNIVIVMKDGKEFTVNSYRGPQGEQGASIVDITIDPSTFYSTFYLSDGTEITSNVSLRGLRGPAGPQGRQGVQGERGAPFQVSKVYSSIEEMELGFEDGDVAVGEYVLISTVDVNDPDNAKVFVRTETHYNFLTDLSGKEGIQGPQGPQGPEGPAPTRGVDYWTPDDIATIKEYVEQAIQGGRW